MTLLSSFRIAGMKSIAGAQLSALIWLSALLVPVVAAGSDIASDIDQVVAIPNKLDVGQSLPMKRLIAMGQPAYDQVLARLRSTEDARQQDALVEILYQGFSSAEFFGEQKPMLGAIDIRRLIDLMATDHPGVKVGAMIVCGKTGPACAAGVRPMLAVLRTASDDLNYVLSQYELGVALVSLGSDALDAVIDEVRASDDARYLRSLAGVLRDKPIPEDVQAKLAAVQAQ